VTSPLVSVIIPTYNRAIRVQRAVASALGQSHSAVEVIVVDDGSTDRTADLLDERFADETRLVVVRTDNAGVSSARNTGMAVATGSHIAFLDSDDEWFPWKLEFQLACLDRLPDAGLIWSDMRAVNADGKEVAPLYLRTFYHRYAEIDLADHLEGPDIMSRPEFGDCEVWHGDIYRAMLGGNLIHTSTVLMTRDRLASVQSFDESLVRTGEDFDFHLRAAAAGAVAFADTATITYRVGAPDQLTRPDLMVQMAINYLATIEKAIAADYERTSARDLDRSRAGAHGWLGEELFDAGLPREARPHLRAAFRGRHRLRATAFYLLTRLPTALATSLRRFVGRLTRPFRRRAAE